MKQYNIKKKEKFQVPTPEPTCFRDYWREFNRLDDETLNLQEIAYSEQKGLYEVTDLRKGYILLLDDRMGENNSFIHRLTMDQKELLRFLKDRQKKYKDEDNVSTYELKDTIKKLKLYIRSKKPSKYKKLSKNGITIKEGTILYTSWGYDQTNVEFYRVARIIGKSYFILQEIEAKRIYPTSSLSETVVPGQNDLNKLPIKAYMGDKGYMQESGKGGYTRSLWLYDGKSKHRSWSH